MSEEQLSALLAKLKDDAGFREKFQHVADLDAAETMAREAGFDVIKADWLQYQGKQTLELSDKELEGVAGGNNGKRSDDKSVNCTGPRDCSERYITSRAYSIDPRNC